MHGAAQTLAQQALALDFRPDLILATDMLDVAQFLAFTRKQWGNIPTAAYFHENQLTYPWSDGDPDIGTRDNHYAYINYTTACVSDHIFFNSHYHQRSLLDALPGFLAQFPDFTHPDIVSEIALKSEILPIGLSLKEKFTRSIPHATQRPALVWNHRWEYDKAPETFFETLFALQDAGQSFDLIVMGEHFAKYPSIFDTAKCRFEQDSKIQILQWGYATTAAEYSSLLQRGTILPVTSRHDFFGVSVVEAIAAGCAPLLPKRLAYPEHIPPTLHAQFLYKTDAQLLPTLSQWLLAPPDPTPIQEFVVEQYDWSQLIGKYDEAFAQLMS